MTKKHYVAVAGILKSQRMGALEKAGLAQAGMSGDTYNRALDETGELLAEYFQMENPKFDRARFLEACGIKNAEVSK